MPSKVLSDFMIGRMCDMSNTAFCIIQILHRYDSLIHGPRTCASSRMRVRLAWALATVLRADDVPGAEAEVAQPQAEVAQPQAEATVQTDRYPHPEMTSAAPAKMFQDNIINDDFSIGVSRLCPCWIAGPKTPPNSSVELAQTYQIGMTVHDSE